MSSPTRAPPLAPSPIMQYLRTCARSHYDIPRGSGGFASCADPALCGCPDVIRAPRISRRFGVFRSRGSIVDAVTCCERAHTAPALPRSRAVPDGPEPPSACDRLCASVAREPECPFPTGAGNASPARAKLRRLVRRVLRRHGYPPDQQELANLLIIEQAEAQVEK